MARLGVVTLLAFSAAAILNAVPIMAEDDNIDEVAVPVAMGGDVDLEMDEDDDVEIDLIEDYDLDDDDEDDWEMTVDPRDKWTHDDWPKCTDLVDIYTDDTWEAEVAKHPLVVMSFCNSESKHEEECFPFDKEFRITAQMLSKSSLTRKNPPGSNESYYGLPWCGPIHFAYVDSLANPEMRRRFHLTRFPMAAVFKHGQPWSIDMKQHKEWFDIYNTILEIGSLSDPSTAGFKQYYQEPKDPDIVDIWSDKQLNDLASTHQMVLAEFYAPWCGYCQDFMPQYGEAARFFKKHKSDEHGHLSLRQNPSEEVPFVRINSDGPGKKIMMAKYGIAGYPTFMVFYQGTPYKYFGGHEPQHITYELSNFFPFQDRKVVAMEPEEEELLPLDEDAVIELTAETFNSSLVGNSDLNAVFFYAPWCAHCKKMHKPWSQAATYLKTHFSKSKAAMFKMDATHPESKLIAEMYGITGYPTVQMFKDTQPYLYRGKRTVGGIVNHMRFWQPNDQDKFKFTFEGMTEEMKIKGDPNAVEVLNDANFGETVLESNDSWLLEFYAPWCGHCKNLQPEFEKAATNMQSKVRFGKIDCTVNAKTCGDYGVEGYPVLLSYDMNAGEKTIENAVKFTGERKYDGLNSFAKGLGINEEGQVIALTEQSFRAAVFDRKLGPEPWMIEFYAPWCGHCKQLAPEWARAARSLNSKVRFGKVDATAEKTLAEEYEIQGLPTIYFFSSQDPHSKPLAYDGPDRSSASIIAYARKHGIQSTQPTDAKEESATATFEVGVDGDGVNGKA